MKRTRLQFRKSILTFLDTKLEEVCKIILKSEVLAALKHSMQLSPNTITILFIANALYSLGCSFYALSRINSQFKQQNARSCFVNVYVTLRHKKFRNVSIYKTISIREHKILHETQWTSVHIVHTFCVLFLSTSDETQENNQRAL
jgi:hypothetical protein